MLLQPGHQLHQVAGAVAVVELPHQDVVPAVLHCAGAAGQREQIGPARHPADRARLHGGRADLLEAEHAEQLPEALDAFLESKSSGIKTVLQLDVNEEELKRRIAERKKVSGRADDDEDKLVKRIDEYFNKTVHVLPYYEAQGKLTVVNGIGEIDHIFGQLCEAIETV